MRGKVRFSQTLEQLKVLLSKVLTEVLNAKLGNRSKRDVRRSERELSNIARLCQSAVKVWEMENITSRLDELERRARGAN